MSLRMSYQPPRILLPGIQPGWAMSIPPEWLARDNPEPNPITIKPKTVSHAAEQFSWVPLPYCSPPRCPLPIKSLALSARVSPLSVRQDPTLGPWKGSPFLQQVHKHRYIHAQACIKYVFSPYKYLQNTYLSYFVNISNAFFFFNLCVMRDLSSLTRDQTWAPCNGSAES